MTKKKIAIYCTIACVFLLLFSVYVWTEFNSNVYVNEQRLQESMRVTKQQIEKNLQSQAKDLELELVAWNLHTQGSLQDLIQQLHNESDKNEEYFIIDSSGALHNSLNKQNNIKIEQNALKASRAAGYSAVSISNGQNTGGVGIIVPLSKDSSYYLAKMITLEHFFNIIAADLPVTADGLCLFDEWGGKISDYDANTDVKIKDSILNGAVKFSSGNEGKAFYGNGLDGSYNIFVTVGQPKGWFIGARISYNGTEPSFFGLNVSKIVILLVLICILAAVVCLDIFNDKEKKQELTLANGTDALTGLVASSAMPKIFEKEFEKRSCKGYSFVCLDIIAFSRINTMFGHSLGDSLLQTIGSVIKNFGKCGTRINADCFAFLAKSNEKLVEEFESKLNNEISLHLGAEYLQMITFKYGIYNINETKPVFHEIFEGAKLALKDAKKQPVLNYVVFDSNLRQSVEMQKNIEVNMMHALSKEEFVVYIQPQFDMPGEKCTRGETLIRWNSEYMGFLPPDQFIPVFERNGFIVETDFFMLISALELQKKRISAGKQPITLAVNQSKVTIAFPNYYERLKSIITGYEVPLNYIELEITESTLENSWETIVPLIHNIKKLGFSIAMDDFGSGFSSLNTLRILPIDVLKIDKAFLQESDTSERCRTIIKNVVNMAKELRMHVVCEGVETKEQLEFLKSIGCDIVQGYYYSKPIPQDEFEEKFVKN